MHSACLAIFFIVAVSRFGILHVVSVKHPSKVPDRLHVVLAVLDPKGSLKIKKSNKRRELRYSKNSVYVKSYAVTVVAAPASLVRLFSSGPLVVVFTGTRSLGLGECDFSKRTCHQ